MILFSSKVVMELAGLSNLISICKHNTSTVVWVIFMWSGTVARGKDSYCDGEVAVSPSQAEASCDSPTPQGEGWGTRLVQVQHFQVYHSVGILVS